MLNELRTLARSLAAHGAAPIVRHPDLSQLLKGDVVRVRLKGDGEIDRLDLLPGKTRGDVWTLRDGKHNGFPGLKTARGLLVLDRAARAAHDAIWKAAAKSAAAKRQEIARLAAQFPVDPEAGDWPKTGHRRRIAERLAELRPLEADPLACSVPTAFARFLQTLEIEPPFLARLTTLLLDRARNGGDEWLDPVRAAWVDGAVLAIDVDDGFARDAGDAQQIEAVSRTHGNDGLALSDAPRAECALSGSSVRLLDGPFPQPTLPSLGQTYLFARNKDIPAMARYGCNGAGSLPIDAQLAGQLAGALVAITEPVRKEKTWRLLPAEAGDRSDLLLAFVAADLERPLAGALGDEKDPDEDEEDPDDDAPKIVDMEYAATAMLARFDAVRTQSRDPAEARILVLRSVDPANRKAIYDRKTDVNRLYERAETWTVAMRNTPPGLSLPVLVKKKLRMGYALPQPPLALTALSRRLYVRGGREAFDAPGLPLSEGLALFLEEGDTKRRAHRVLRLLLQRQHDLLAGLAHAGRRGDLADFDKTGQARRDGLRSAAWMGALLWFAGRTKEIYMDDTGFKLGQLLAAADAVHLGYCADRRQGDVPPALVGASVFASAGRDPVRTLAILQQRLKPYLEWIRREAEVRGRARALLADKAEGKDAKSSKVRAGRIFDAADASDLWRRLARELAEALPAKSDSETFRAELLLGYLAGIKPEPKTEKPAEETTP